MKQQTEINKSQNYKINKDIPFIICNNNFFFLNIMKRNFTHVVIIQQTNLAVFQQRKRSISENKKKEKK
jgi:hypothetical protein